jgi:SAM-dependent methyltransferase
VTSALGAHATEYIGIDLSENMVAAYNQRFNSNNTTSHSSSNSNPSSVVADRADTSDERPPQAHAVVGNLLAAEDDDEKPNGPTHLSGPEYHDFDLVVVGLGFHHFADVRLAAKRLSSRLKPGGVFLILDFVTHAAIQHEHDAHRDLKDAAHTVKHHGFSEADLRNIFTDAAGAGLEDFAIVRMGEEVLLRGTSRREPFMARGRKPKPQC